MGLLPFCCDSATGFKIRCFKSTFVRALLDFCFTLPPIQPVRGRDMTKLFHSIASLSVLLVASVSANAADMSVPVKAPPPVMAPPFSWTGFYVGGNLGGAWANTTITDSLFGLNFSNRNNAVFVAGGQAGFNYQFSNVVVGVEGDFDWAANNNNTT